MLARVWERRKDDEGFTLIELVVVVLILGITIAIALPTIRGARQRIQDRAAQSDLRKGLAAADTFFTEDDTYRGFDATAAEAIEPSLNWSAAAEPDFVTISVVSDSEIELERTSESGRVFCIARDVASASGRHTGDTAATSDFAGCDGGW